MGVAESSDDMIKKAISLGVAKINVNTECQLAFADATRKYIEAGKDLEGKGFDPRKLLAPGAEAIKDMVITKDQIIRIWKEKLTNKIYHFLMKSNIDNVNVDNKNSQRMLWSSLLIFSFIRRDVDFVDFFSC